jgi:hypothetical protein
LYVPVIHQMMGMLTGRLPESSRVRGVRAGPGYDRPPRIVTESARIVVRNIDPAESEIERTTGARLREAYQLGDAAPTDRGEDVSSPAMPIGSQRPDEMGMPVAWALLILLVAEVFVANRTYP